MFGNECSCDSARVSAWPAPPQSPVTRKLPPLVPCQRFFTGFHNTLNSHQEPQPFPKAVFFSVPSWHPVHACGKFPQYLSQPHALLFWGGGFRGPKVFYHICFRCLPSRVGAGLVVACVVHWPCVPIAILAPRSSSSVLRCSRHHRCMLLQPPPLSQDSHPPLTPRQGLDYGGRVPNTSL